MRTALLAVTALLAACTTMPPPTALLAPNANLMVQGIPPVPMALVERVARYTDFRGHGFVEWHPVRDEMLVAHRKAGDNKAQLYRLAQPMGALEQITDGDDPVTSATWEPREGKYLVFERSQGGDEADQLYRLDLPSRQTTLLTNPDEAHSIAGWVRATSTLLYTAVPLDRTAVGGSRPTINTTLWAIDPAQPATARRKVAVLPGPGWFAGDVADDGQRIAFTRYRSANESQVWVIDLASGQARQVLPAPGETVRATHFAGGFSKDGKRLVVISDRAGEFREAMTLDLASGALQRLTGHIPWDVTAGAASDDGRWFAAQINADGRDELRLFDAADGKELGAPKVPAGGISSNMKFHRRTQRLAMSINSSQGPNQVFAHDPASGRTVQWTRAHAPAGVDTTTFGDQRIVRWKGFDGLTISGLTSGYGKTFLTLDNGTKREDSVKDIGALLDWIAQQPDLDASRVLVTGGSYGGYMTLASAVHYSDRIVGGLPVVGPSNFVTFLTNTESYRRDLRRVEYGDERDPAMRAWMEKTAPLNNADKIRKPLFVVQGKNDPRVPFTESEQIVAKVRANGLPVWYLRGENEGHGFVRKENVDFEFYATVLFVEDRLQLR